MIEKYTNENKKDLDQQDADHQQHLASLASGSVVAASGDCSGSDGEGFINLGQFAAHRDAQRILEEASRSMPSRAQLAHESLLRRAKRCDDINADVELQRTSVASAESENVDAMAALTAALNQTSPPSDAERRRLTDVLNQTVAKLERRQTKLDKSVKALEEAAEAYSASLLKTEQYDQLLREGAPVLDAQAKAGEAQPETDPEADPEADQDAEGVAEAKERAANTVGDPEPEPMPEAFQKAE